VSGEARCFICGKVKGVGVLATVRRKSGSIQVCKWCLVGRLKRADELLDRCRLLLNDDRLLADVDQFVAWN